MMWVVEHPRLGYLRLPQDLGGPVELGDEFSITSDIGDCTALGQERAEDFAARLNKREGHKLWKAVPWRRAYQDWKSRNP